MVAEVIVDITERKQAEAERLDLERRISASQRLEGLGLLAGGVAHNFNNLLTVILGHAELLNETQPADVNIASSVREIIKAGSRSRDLIGQLLAMGRRQVLELKPLDLNMVVRECGSMLRQALRENITVEYRLSDSPCPVAADPGRIDEVLLNLALNAQDAILREGTISIATEEILLEGVFARRHDDVPPGRYVLLTVSDTGRGMDEATAARVFDPFFTTKELGAGTGLGLSTVYGVVKQHNGSIEVASIPGRGTRFMIYLPRTDAAPQSVHHDVPEKPARGEETILLVEDEAPIRTMLSRHLRALGYTVLDADGGVSALRMASAYGEVIHILVTDVVMPGMNGTELYERLRGAKPQMKVLYMSGYQRDVIDSHVVRGAEADLLTKPFAGHTLATRVREILDR
jgi:nitrogen-specific signal transduction histidine kinase